jgi:uncharacterized protein GlcG (DUF336 family)
MKSRCFIFGLTLLAAVQAVSAAEKQLAVSVMRLTTGTALSIARAALDECRKKGVQISVQVVDRGGHPQVMLRDTLAVDLTTRLAYEKAYTALSFNVPTSQLSDRATSALGNGDGLLMLAGGLPIEVGGIIYGAVGVSGAQSVADDEACAKAGLDAVRDELELM